ncbi:MAG: hypothetical protein M1831_001054 [Alyxoria varia]|nr:MAG: hypothetical protein M1831_001054 [Alyxoria varia]
MSYFYGSDTPPSVTSARDNNELHLITMNTPNGKKVQIMLEELNALYGTKWSTTTLNIMTNEQKKDWFLRLDPNGRIPILVDNTQKGEEPFSVHETSAELLYLQDNFDKNGAFWFDTPRERNEALQWLFFWHGSGAPYQGITQGQMNHFGKFAKVDLPYAKERFRNETLRVYGVLELHLSGHYSGQPRDYLAGKGKGKYSVADMGTWPWISAWEFSGVPKEEMQKMPHLLQWIDRVAARPAVQKGVGAPYDRAAQQSDGSGGGVTHLPEPKTLQKKNDDRKGDGDRFKL